MPFSGTAKKESPYPSQFLEGVNTFALLFTRWMDTNEWSYPVMTSLAKALLNSVF